MRWAAMSFSALFGMALRALLFGLFGAAVAYSLLRHVIRFRAEWPKVFGAAILSNFVCAITERTMIIVSDPQDPNFLLKIWSATAAASVITALAACRLMIRSESGRTPGVRATGVAAAGVVGPALALGAMILVAFNSYD